MTINITTATGQRVTYTIIIDGEQTIQRTMIMHTSELITEEFLKLQIPETDTIKLQSIDSVEPEEIEIEHDDNINELSKKIETEGELNYVITRLATYYIKNNYYNQINYASINSAMVLGSCLSWSKTRLVLANSRLNLMIAPRK